MKASHVQKAKRLFAEANYLDKLDDRYVRRYGWNDTSFLLRSLAAELVDQAANSLDAGKYKGDYNDLYVSTPPKRVSSQRLRQLVSDYAADDFRSPIFRERARKFAMGRSR